MIRTLPLPLEPLTGESWFGYIRRAAELYRTSWQHLLAPLVPSGARLFRYAHTGRALGLFATPETLELVSKYFGITRTAAESMFLNRYASILDIPEERVRSLDPLRAPEHGKQPSVLSGTHGLRGGRARPGCGSCTRSGYWMVTWQLVLHRYCISHRERIVDTQAPSAAQSPPTALELASQERILKALNDPLHHEEHLRHWLGLLHKHRDAPLTAIVARPLPLPPLPRLANIPLKDGARAHVAAALRAGYSPNSTDTLEGLRRNPNSLTLLYLRHHQPMIRASRNPPPDLLARLPHLVPTETYYGDLSDLSYPLDLTIGRRVARTAIQMLLTGQPVWDATRDLHAQTQQPFVRLMGRLEMEGRLERYWDAIAEAANALSEGTPDYRERVRLIDCGEAFDTTRRVLKGRLAIKHWLIDRWACTFRHNFGTKQDQGQLDKFEALNGRTARAALAKLEAA